MTSESGRLVLVGVLQVVIDVLGLKATFIRMLDALHLALITRCIYHYLVINYGNTSALAQIAWCFKVSSYLSALRQPLTSSVQLQVAVDVRCFPKICNLQ